jgi:hypothetical protein
MIEVENKRRIVEQVGFRWPIRSWEKLGSELGGNPGSPALRSALSAAGLATSDCNSRWPVKQLPLSGMRYQ